MKGHTLTIQQLLQTARRVVPAGGHVWLYGSRARGDYREDSDWDILILLDKEKEEADDFRDIAYPFVELGWQCATAVNPQIYTTKEWSLHHFAPYQQNVERDKIVIL